MSEEEIARQAWAWRRLHDATPGEAMYLAVVHRDVDPRRRGDTLTAADLLARHREDNRPRPTTKEM